MLVFFVLGGVCVSGGREKYLLETSVVNMSNDVVIRLYLCSFSLEIALEKCLRLARVRYSVGVYGFSVNIQFSEGGFRVLRAFLACFSSFGGVLSCWWGEVGE